MVEQVLQVAIISLRIVQELLNQHVETMPIIMVMLHTNIILAMDVVKHGLPYQKLTTAIVTEDVA